jgi:hypothetical protein
MAIIGLFQCDPWRLPTQNWLKNATNDISIQEFHNVTRHYVKDTGINGKIPQQKDILSTNKGKEEYVKK